MGQPGNRMPVAGMERKKGPFYCFHAQAFIDMCIGSHIIEIIIIDEIEVYDRKIKEKNQKAQDDGDQIFCGKLGVACTVHS